LKKLPASKSTGLPVLLLPGLICDAGVWAHQIAALEDDYRLVIADFSSGERIRTFAENALHTMHAERFAVAGFSMGGYVALEIMRKAPQRVAALALIDTSARPDSPESLEIRRKAIEKAPEDFDSVMRELLPRLLHPSRTGDKPLTASIMQMAARVGSAAFVRQQQAIMGRIDSRPALGSIRCPVLVLCGEDDLLTPLAFSEEMASLIVGARLKTVAACGHMSLMEKPEEVNTALRSFLSDVRGSVCGP